MDSLNQLVADALSVYKSETLRPCYGRFMSADRCGGCALTAAYVRHHGHESIKTDCKIDKEICRWAESHYKLTPHDIDSFIWGFDNLDVLATSPNAFDIGFRLRLLLENMENATK